MNSVVGYAAFGVGMVDTKVCKAKRGSHAGNELIELLTTADQLRSTRDYLCVADPRPNRQLRDSSVLPRVSKLYQLKWRSAIQLLRGINIPVPAAQGYRLGQSSWPGVLEFRWQGISQHAGCCGFGHGTLHF